MTINHGHVVVLLLVLVWYVLPGGHGCEVPLGRLIGFVYLVFAVLLASMGVLWLALFDFVAGVAFTYWPRGLNICQRRHDGH